MTDKAVPLSPDDDDDLLAAELALGVLDAAERGAAQHRRTIDAAFAARVSRWEVRLSTLNVDYETAPAPSFLPAIEKRLFGPPPQSPHRWFWRLMAGVLAAGIVAVVILTILPLSGGGQ